MNLKIVAAILFTLGTHLVHANEFESLDACASLDDLNCLVEAQGIHKPTPQFLAGSKEHPHAAADPPIIEYCDSGLKLSINKRFDNPSILSNFDILYGKAEVEIKASHGTGIISSFYLQSKNLDEIDVAETFGCNPYEFQTNFFIKGNTSTHDRGFYHKMDDPPMDEFHKYGIEWTEDKIVWLLNGDVIRIVTNDHPQGFPHAPMYIKFSLWAGGDELNEKGTIDWSGGRTDYNDLPYAMYIKNLHVTDYSTGFEHTYGDSLDDWITTAPKDHGIRDGNKFEVIENAFNDFDASGHTRNDRDLKLERSSNQSTIPDVVRNETAESEQDKSFWNADQNSTVAVANSGFSLGDTLILILETLIGQLLVLLTVC